MARQYCNNCQYPTLTCVCEGIQPIYPKTKLLILQHPSEVDHAKNTVKLLKLAIPDTKVVVGESVADFALIKASLLAQPSANYLLYPSENSIELSNQDNTRSAQLVLLDATWRKALKMYRLNPWLQTLPQYHFTPAAQSNYCIRKAKREDSLSTLEAAIQGISTLENIDTSPVSNLFSIFINKKLQLMPASVRKRY